jgi:hypothetical protein
MLAFSWDWRLNGAESRYAMLDRHHERWEIRACAASMEGRLGLPNLTKEQQTKRPEDIAIKKQNARRESLQASKSNL